MAKSKFSKLPLYLALAILFSAIIFSGISSETTQQSNVFTGASVADDNAITGYATIEDSGYKDQLEEKCDRVDKEDQGEYYFCQGFTAVGYSTINWLMAFLTVLFVVVIAVLSAPAALGNKWILAGGLGFVASFSTAFYVFINDIDFIAFMVAFFVPLLAIIFAVIAVSVIKMFFSKSGSPWGTVVIGSIFFLLVGILTYYLGEPSKALSAFIVILSVGFLILGIIGLMWGMSKGSKWASVGGGIRDALGLEKSERKEKVAEKEEVKEEQLEFGEEQMAAEIEKLESQAEQMIIAGKVPQEVQQVLARAEREIFNEIGIERRELQLVEDAFSKLKTGEKFDPEDAKEINQILTYLQKEDRAIRMKARYSKLAEQELNNSRKILASGATAENRKEALNHIARAKLYTQKVYQVSLWDRRADKLVERLEETLRKKTRKNESAVKKGKPRSR